METKTYVRFWTPGLFISDSTVREVASRDVNALTDIPDSAYAAEFFDVAYYTEGGVEMHSNELNTSGRYFFGGRVLSLEQVERANNPDWETLLDNMRWNDIPAVIETRFGQCIPFRLGVDQLVEAQQA